MLKRTLIVFSVLCLTAAANLRAEAGDYYTYRDAKGNLVISNSAPPPAAKVIAKQTLGEVTDQEIAEARAREQDAALQNRLSSFEATDEQQSNSRPPTSAAEYAQPDTGGGSVVVGVSNESVRRPPHRLATNPPGRRPAPTQSLPGGVLPGSLPGGSLPAGSLPGGRTG